MTNAKKPKLPPANNWKARTDTYQEILRRVREGDLLVKDGKLFKTYERIGRGPKKPLKIPKEVGNRDKRGYIKYNFKFQDKSRTVMVHRVIYAVSNGLTQIDPTLVINHKNGNPSDNMPENLELVTQQENVLHALNTGLRDVQNNNTAKLSWEDVLKIRELMAEGHRDREIAEKYKMNRSSIRNIRTGKCWVGRDAV